ASGILVLNSPNVYLRNIVAGATGATDAYAIDIGANSTVDADGVDAQATGASNFNIAVRNTGGLLDLRDSRAAADGGQHAWAIDAEGGAQTIITGGTASSGSTTPATSDNYGLAVQGGSFVSVTGWQASATGTGSRGVIVGGASTTNVMSSNVSGASFAV